MFVYDLFPFQKQHEENMLNACKTNKQIVLFAPTGSGKTVIASKFIDDYLDENPDTVFFWLCPGAGGLETQSQETYSTSVPNGEVGDVYDFINNNSPGGKVFFINWDKINKKSNTVLKEGERKNLIEQVENCHKNKLPIFIVIDEEHKYRETASYFVDLIRPVHILRISATPFTTEGHLEKITDDEVISAGLIASGISINEGVEEYIQEHGSQDDDLDLVELADIKRKEIMAEYSKRGLNIRPLVLIQFPNGSPEWIEKIEQKLSNLGYDKNSGLITKWFSEEHPEEVEELKKLNGKYAFLLFKQAVATGWDCPRAKILIKLREGGTEAFNIQTIGRIRRMPERHHYDSDLLDHCYLYTLDSEFNEGLTKSLNDSFYTMLYKKKEAVENIGLTKEYLDGDDHYAINPDKVVNVVKQQFLIDCDSDEDGILSREDMMHSKGYVFGDVLKAESFAGVARTTSEIKNLNKIFAGEHQIRIHDDGFIIRNAKRKIAAAAKIDENITNNVLEFLFAPIDEDKNDDEIQFEKSVKLIQDMDRREYNAFLINNCERLREVFGRTPLEEIAEIEETEIISKEWEIPKTQYYKEHKIAKPSKYLEKNVFEKYGDNILISPNRSHSEVVFENWCENNNLIKWVYKNGDKGDEFFSLVYRRAYGRQHFYPDYIIKTKTGKIWIVEVKGGADANGNSENVDRYASEKMMSLKEYGKKYTDISWCVVRAFGQSLFASDTIWIEDLFNESCWKPINTIIIE